MLRASPYLQQFRRVVPEFDELIVLVRKLLAHDPGDLEFLHQAIKNHLERHGIESTQAAELAEEMTCDLCSELPSTAHTVQALRKYTSTRNCFNAYDRLLTEFKDQLTKHEYRSLVERGVKLFENEIITWDPPED